MSRCRIGSLAGSACHFFIIIVIRDETTAAAPWALLLIVRNDAITIAVWTGFQARLRRFIEPLSSRGVAIIAGFNLGY